MKDDKYRLERSELKAMTFEEADDHVTYWNDKRLNAACFIINQVFGVTPFNK